MAQSRRIGSGRYSLPSHLDYYDENWSPRASRTEPSFDSDEDKDEEMSSPESFLPSRESQGVHSDFYASFTNSLSFENRPEAIQSCKASSRYLTIGRPTRSVGLKDIDLSNIPRAEYIRHAKEASKSPKRRHTSAPVAVLSSPALFSVEANNRQVSKFKDRPSLSSRSKVPEVHTASEPVRDIFSEMKVKSKFPENIPHQSRGQRAASFHGNNVPFIDLTVGEEQENSNVIGISRRDSEDEEVFTSQASDQEFLNEKKCPSSVQRRWQSAMMLTKKSENTAKEEKELSFSDDEVDYDCMKKTSKQPLCKSPTMQQRSCYVLTLQSLLFLLAAVIGFSLYLHHNPHGLCLEAEFKSNLMELERAMEEELYGQHLARKIVMAAMRSHVNQPSKKPLVLSFHGGTGVGKNFVSSLIAKHLFKWGYQSAFVHKIIVPLHFPHKSEVEHYCKQLSSWITGNVSRCSKRALFIFDEMDKIDTFLMETLQPLLNHRGVKSGVLLKGSIFLFLSNSGGKAINRFAWEHYQQGKERELISLPALEGILHKVADQNEDMWYREMLKSGVIDHFVPFLPLERKHVKQCIRHDVKKKELLIEEKVVSEIADQMTYFPQDFEVFSASGCKKVSSKVDVGMN